MKIDRLISIIMILLERRTVPIPELARLCEVSPRTISRDLNTINQAGIPIVSYPGLHGGVGIMDNYKLEKRLFSTADVTALLMGLGCIKSSLSGQDVVNALAKVHGIIPAEQRGEIESRARRLSIDFSPWTGGRSYTEETALILKSIEDRNRLSFSYTDRLGNKTFRTVEPYRLLLKNMRWYLDAYCPERGAWRLFKLARISGIKAEESRFAPRDYRPEPEIRADFQDKNLVRIRVRLTAAARERFADLFGEDCFSGSEDGYFLADIPFSDDERGYCFLLGFGVGCECISPPAVREHVKQYLQTVAGQYVTI